MRLRTLAAVAAATALALTSLAACGSDDSGDSAKRDVTIHVFAAASLTESFTELGKQFEKRSPRHQGRVQLRTQLRSRGADRAAAPRPTCSRRPARATWTPWSRVGDAEDPKDFATNSMEIAVPPDNPAQITALGDLAGQGVKVALCQPQVPCGKVAAEVFANAGLTVKPATEEVDVKSVLTKVQLDEVDAGIVYVTDVLAAGDKVKGVEIPDTQNASTSYPIAALEGSKHQKEAAEFVDLVLSDDGAKVLEEAGFAKP